MAAIAWLAQLKACQAKIVELEEKIALRRQQIQRLLDQKKDATYAQRLLAISEQSLQRANSTKQLIERRLVNLERNDAERSDAIRKARFGSRKIIK